MLPWTFRHNVGIAFGSRCIKCIHVRSINIRAGFPTLHQVGSHKKRPSYGNEIAFACGQVLFGTFGIGAMTNQAFTETLTFTRCACWNTETCPLLKNPQM